MHEGLRLHEAARESEGDAALRKRPDVDRHRHAQRGVDGQQGSAGVEITRRDRIRIGAKERLGPLVHRARHMQPPELVNRRVDAGGRGLGGILHVLRRILEAELIEQVVRTRSAGTVLYREAGEVLDLRLGQIEGKEGLGIALIGLDREIVLLVRNCHGCAGWSGRECGREFGGLAISFRSDII